MLFKIEDKVKLIKKHHRLHEWCGDDTAVLVDGTVYEIEKLEVSGWSTLVFLKGIAGSFNSVAFQKVAP